MRIAPLAYVIAALALGAQLAAAQQPVQGQRSDAQLPRRVGAPSVGMQLNTLDSLRARVDTLVSRLNKAPEARRSAALTDLVRELASQNGILLDQMRDMLIFRDRTSRTLREQGGARPAAGAGDSARADSAGRGRRPQ